VFKAYARTTSNHLAQAYERCGQAEHPDREGAYHHARAKVPVEYMLTPISEQALRSATVVWCGAWSVAPSAAILPATRVTLCTHCVASEPDAPVRRRVKLLVL
jgi:hypothetical protein